MLSTAFKSRPVGHILRFIILGRGTTLISLGNRINPSQIQEELLMLKITILQDFLLLIRIMDARSLEETMKEFMKMTGQSISDVRQSTMVNTQAIAKLEMQMGQLANYLGERDKGKLPSHAVNNPKACNSGNSSNQEHEQAIVTLRSGKRVDNKVMNPEEEQQEKEEQKEEEGDNQKEADAETSTVTPVIKEPPRAFVPKAPYPERLQALGMEGS
jgi:hypothetical protein